MFNLEKARKYFSYDQNSGLFTRLISAGNAKAGMVCNAVDTEGYIRISLDKEYIKAHTLAWYFVHGVRVDGLNHINGIKSDNRICNLRIATAAENQRNKGIQKNNRTGVKGVWYWARLNRYVASIYVQGKRIYLGQHKTLEQAKLAYEEAAMKLHGDFARFE